MNKDFLNKPLTLLENPKYLFILCCVEFRLCFSSGSVSGNKASFCRNSFRLDLSPAVFSIENRIILKKKHYSFSFCWCLCLYCSEGKMYLKGHKGQYYHTRKGRALTGVTFLAPAEGWWPTHRAGDPLTRGLGLEMQVSVYQSVSQ